MAAIHFSFPLLTQGETLAGLGALQALHGYLLQTFEAEVLFQHTLGGGTLESGGSHHVAEWHIVIILVQRAHPIHNSRSAHGWDPGCAWPTRGVHPVRFQPLACFPDFFQSEACVLVFRDNSLLPVALLHGRLDISSRPAFPSARLPPQLRLMHRAPFF